MNLSIVQANLAAALKAATRALPVKSYTPVLSCVRLDATGESLTISATDLTLSISAPAPGMIFTPGGVCVPGKVLLQFVDSLPADARVALDADAKRLKLASGGTKASFQTLPLDDFPVTPPLDPTWEVTLPAAELRRCLKQTLIAVRQFDPERPILEGVNVALDLAEKTLTLVGTNGFMLARTKAIVVTGNAGAGDCRVTLPQRTAKELAALLPEEGDVTLGATEGRVVLAWSETRLHSTVLAGRYPNADQVIPTRSVYRITVARAPLAHAVKLASYIAPGELRVARLFLDGETLTVSATSEQAGFENAIGVHVLSESGEPLAPLKIGLNVDYLTDVLGVVESDEVEIALTSASSPALFRPVGDDRGPDAQLAVIMPMTIKEATPATRPVAPVGVG